jgi:hypothetical protein
MFLGDVLQKFVNLSPPDCPAGTYKDRKAEGVKAYLKEHVFPSVHKFSSNLRIVNATNLTRGLSDLEKINIAVAMQKKVCGRRRGLGKIVQRKRI